MSGVRIFNRSVELPVVAFWLLDGVRFLEFEILLLLVKLALYFPNLSRIDIRSYERAIEDQTSRIQIIDFRKVCFHRAILRVFYYFSPNSWNVLPWTIESIAAVRSGGGGVLPDVRDSEGPLLRRFGRRRPHWRQRRWWSWSWCFQLKIGEISPLSRIEQISHKFEKILYDSSCYRKRKFSKLVEIGKLGKKWPLVQISNGWNDRNLCQ